MKGNYIEHTHFYSSIWFWISIFEFLFLIFLLNKQFKIRKQTKLNNLFVNNSDGETKNIDVIIGDIMNDINHSKKLYKELIKVCHPDRYINQETHLIALSIFQEITENENNYSKLLQLKKRAEQGLNVKFKI
jgi:hypothetical protein